MQWRGPNDGDERTRTWFAWFPVVFWDGTRHWLEHVSIEEKFYGRGGDGTWIGSWPTLRVVGKEFDEAAAQRQSSANPKKKNGDRDVTI